MRAFAGQGGIVSKKHLSSFECNLFMVSISSHVRCIQTPTQRSTRWKQTPSEVTLLLQKDPQPTGTQFCSHCSPPLPPSPHRHGNPIPPERQSGGRSKVWKPGAFPLPLPFLSFALCTSFYTSLSLSISRLQMTRRANKYLLITLRSDRQSPQMDGSQVHAQSSHGIE